jgi:multiple sugar transport system ATP-binding protein
MIAGLERISGGDISIGGRVVNDVAPKDRNIAMVFQSYALYPHKTVAQNMGFALLLAGTSKSEIDAKVRSAAEILDLTHLLDRFPKQLSGGQRQRVAMGRAIVRDPQVFLFDEPLSNLDAKLRVQMRTEIKALHQRLKTTIVYVTHDQVEAMTMADRIVVMNKGQVEQVGRPLDLYDHPANLFVAGFIGSPSMNLFDGTTETSEKGSVFRFEQAKVALGIPRQTSAGPASARKVLGIRPEHLDIGRGEHKAEVITTEPTGAETMVALRMGGKEFLAASKERLDFKPGEIVPVGFPTERIHLFDRDSGLRLS